MMPFSARPPPASAGVTAAAAAQVASLFRTRRLADVRAVEARVAADATASGEKLRGLLAGRYGVLLGAADGVAALAESAAGVAADLTRVGGGATALASRLAPAPGGRSATGATLTGTSDADASLEEGGLGQASERDTVRRLGACLALLSTAPEALDDAMEAGDLAGAAAVLARAPAAAAALPSAGCPLGVYAAAKARAAGGRRPALAAAARAVLAAPAGHQNGGSPRVVRMAGAAAAAVVASSSVGGGSVDVVVDAVLMARRAAFGDALSGGTGGLARGLVDAAEVVRATMVDIAAVFLVPVDGVPGGLCGAALRKMGAPSHGESGGDAKDALSQTVSAAVATALGAWVVDVTGLVDGEAGRRLAARGDSLPELADALAAAEGALCGVDDASATGDASIDASTQHPEQGADSNTAGEVDPAVAAGWAAHSAATAIVDAGTVAGAGLPRGLFSGLIQRRAVDVTVAAVEGAVDGAIAAFDAAWSDCKGYPGGEAVWVAVTTAASACMAGAGISGAPPPTGSLSTAAVAAVMAPAGDSSSGSTDGGRSGGGGSGEAVIADLSSTLRTLTADASRLAASLPSVADALRVATARCLPRLLRHIHEAVTALPRAPATVSGSGAPLGAAAPPANFPGCDGLRAAVTVPLTLFPPSPPSLSTESAVTVGASGAGAASFTPTTPAAARALLAAAVATSIGASAPLVAASTLRLPSLPTSTTPRHARPAIAVASAAYRVWAGAVADGLVARSAAELAGGVLQHTGGWATAAAAAGTVAGPTLPSPPAARLALATAAALRAAGGVRLPPRAAAVLAAAVADRTAGVYSAILPGAGERVAAQVGLDTAYLSAVLGGVPALADVAVAAVGAAGSLAQEAGTSSPPSFSPAVARAVSRSAVSLGSLPLTGVAASGGGTPPPAGVTPVVAVAPPAPRLTYLPAPLPSSYAAPAVVAGRGGTPSRGGPGGVLPRSGRGVGSAGSSAAAAAAAAAVATKEGAAAGAGAGVAAELASSLGAHRGRFGSRLFETALFRGGG